MNIAEGYEISGVRVPDMERIKTARRKRQQQLKKWIQYDKSMEKKERKGRSSVSPPPGTNAIGRQLPGLPRNVQFSQSVILLEAAARDDLEEVRKLLSQGVCPNVANTDGLTALHQCCIDNNQEMCRLLIRFGAEVNARDTELWTPLHAAATCCHAELSKLLIENGADLLAVNADGNMPYDICEDDSTLDLIESEMASRGITQEDIDEKRRVPEREMLSAMEQLIKTSGNLNQLDSQGAAPLHIAAACGYLDVAGFLLQHGANIDLPDLDGWMPIHVAACWGQFELIEMLTNFGAKLEALTINGGETVFDICEDEKLHERLILLREEMKRRQTIHLTQIQANQSSGKGDKGNKNRTGLNRRRNSNTRSASIRRTSIRDKAKLSWKEARQEADTRSLVVPTGDGDSIVEEVVKTPVWMTSLETATPVGRATVPTCMEANSGPTDFGRRLASNPTVHSSNHLTRSRSPNLSSMNGMKDASSIDKSEQYSRTRSNDHSPPQCQRPSLRLASESNPSSLRLAEAPKSEPLKPVNGMHQPHILQHNAYYPVSVQPVPIKWSQTRAGPPQVLRSTGALPLAGATPGVIAYPLHPGASLTRPPVKRDLLIGDTKRLDQGYVSGGGVGKCCVIM